MGKLLIEPKSKYLIENSPADFSQETIKLYNKTVTEAEQSDEYTLIGVDLASLASKDFGDYSAYTKMRLKDGKWTILEGCNSKEIVEINGKPYDDMHNTLRLKGWDKPIPVWSTNESYAVKGGVILDEETCNEKVDS